MSLYRREKAMIRAEIVDDNVNFCAWPPQIALAHRERLPEPNYWAKNRGNRYLRLHEPVTEWGSLSVSGASEFPTETKIREYVFELKEAVYSWEVREADWSFNPIRYREFKYFVRSFDWVLVRNLRSVGGGAS